MTERQRFALGELAGFHRGVTWSKTQEIAEPEPGSVPVLRIPNIQTRLDTTDLVWLRNVRKTSMEQCAAAKDWILMVGSNGNPERVGNCILINEPNEFLFASFLVGIEPTRREIVSPEFLFNLLQGPDVQRHISNDVQGSTGLSNINLTRLKAKVVECPPLLEQRRIAEILSTLAETIEQTEALISKHQQIKTGLIRDLFTRGVSSNGYLRPTREQAPDLYKASRLGWLPKEWEIVSAEELCPSITKGATPAQFIPQDRSSSVPFIRVQNLTFDGSLAFDEDQAFISRSSSRGELGRSRVLPGDILMNIVGPPLGKVSLIPDTYPEWNINQAIAIFRPVLASVREYLSSFLSSDIAQTWFLGRAKRTSGQVNLTLEMCRQLPIPKPREEEELRRISYALVCADRRIKSERSYLGKLIEQKHGLMHDLLTGRVRVHVEEAEDN